MYIHGEQLASLRSTEYLWFELAKDVVSDGSAYTATSIMIDSEATACPYMLLSALASRCFLLCVAGLALVAV